MLYTFFRIQFTIVYDSNMYVIKDAACLNLHISIILWIYLSVTLFANMV